MADLQKVSGLPVNVDRCMDFALVKRLLSAFQRSLKPMIEKKRRDRINQSLDELRTLLLSHTLDTRLQNPKLEKAEILELTVEYIRNKANRDTACHSPDAGLQAQCGDVGPHVEAAPGGPSSLYSAGFQQCMSRLSSFMDGVNPAQRRSLARGLQPCLGPASPPYPGLLPENEPQSYPVFLHHPYPSPPYSLSPPPSPCYTNASPNFLSATGHFLFPPSTDSSPSSSPLPLPALCPAFPVHVAPPPPSPAPPTPHRPSALPSPTRRGQQGALRRELFPLPADSVWRPWS
ncbi:transcription factor HES-7-like [Conger conger]|uniref:transcription factor HES-7-like n=1 Tax=Conger conger TaxID=82655 RepID=UPI002A5B0EF8|nr:transcription factor HES-7-like [Conger conger]